MLFVLALSLARIGFAASPLVPFLSPGGHPDEAECRRLVKTLAEAGYGQFMLYPTSSLEVEYLSDDYFRMVGHFLDEADRRGMRLWLYDEYNWPSGTARGRVPAENEACLYRELVASTNAAGDVAWTLVASREINIDNYCLDTNNLEPASARRFMELTHKEYARRFGRYMGTLIPGIFTDEPGHCSGARRMKMPEGAVLRIPWWSGMEEEYREASGGRDFRTDISAAIRSGRAGASDALRLWTDLRSRRYRKTYFDPITEWCRETGIVSTGHLLNEDWPGSCAKVNGSPLKTLKGLSKPGIDLIKSDTTRDFEWITLAFGQSAALANGTTGAAELFGIGPCDLTFTVMRKMFWLCALHRIDTFFMALYHHRATRFDLKDTWAMYASPTQPWFGESPLLQAAASEAAAWAKKDFVCDIAVVYPQRQSGACGLSRDGNLPDLRGLCRDLTWNQFTYRLIEEDEPTDRPVVLDWDGRRLFERRSGTRFGNFAEAVAWLDRRFASRPRVKDTDGRTRPGFVTRAYADGSAVAVEAATGEVIVSTDGTLVPRAEKSVTRSLVAKDAPLGLALSGPTRRRVWFWAAKADAQRAVDDWLKREDKTDAVPRYPRDNMAKVTLTAPLKGVRFALQRCSEKRRYSVTLDGRPLAFPKPCSSVAYAYDPLYVETEPMDLAAGEHVFELSGGKDGKLFLPAMWMVGDFMERQEGVLAPLEKQVSLGSLAAVGLASFAGTATYRLQATFAAGERLALDAGDAVVRVRLGGRDLSAKGWAPFDWEIPADLVGKPLPLEIDVITSVRPIFGDERSPDAKLDHALWIKPSLDNPSKVGLRSVFAKRPVKDWKPSVRWRGFNLLGMFRAPTIGLAPDPRVDGFFPEWEFEVIRDWGFNFVRLPIDYRILTTGDSWTNLDPKKMKLLDDAVEYGRRYGLHVQIALHRIPGYCILDQTEAFPLGTNAVAQAAACELWAAFAKRWKGVPNETLSFNLFNEPTRHTAGANYAPLARKLIDAIRAVDAERFIMADGNACASKPVPELYALPSVGQAFRGYTPHAITHYACDFIKTPMEPPTWPLAPGYGEGWIRESPEATVAAYRPAIDAGECCMVGEFGCRNRTPHAVTLAWMEHCLRLWKQNDLGWALWNLRGHNGVLDSGRTDVTYEDFRGHKLDRKMLELLRRW